MSKKERLDKIISNMGFGSRKEIKKIMKDGVVTVNGEVVLDSSMKVDPYESEILYQGIDVSYREYIYLMMNKPDGYLSATYDPNYYTVLDLLEQEHLIFEPFPVGRLDRDTEGLLLISNDGKLAHNLLSPKKKVDKIYYALVDGEVLESHKEKFREGVRLDDGYMTLPAELNIIESGEKSEIELTIQEGKFHQVKRMFQALGMKVTYLKRIEMAGLELDPNLELGEYRELTEEEVEYLKNI